MQQLEHSYITSGSVNWHNYFGKLAISTKVEHMHTLWLVITFLEIHIVRVVGDVGYERIHKEKDVQRVKALFSLSQGKERSRCGEVPQHRVTGRLCSRMFQLGCKVFRCHLRVQGLLLSILVAWGVLFHKFPEALHLQGASSNFLVLRIKDHKTIRVNHALWGPASSGKEGLRKWLLSYYICSP